MTLRKIAAAVGFLLAWWPLQGAAQGDGALVASLFPAQLAVESAKFTDPAVREYVSVRADLEKIGSLN